MDFMTSIHIDKNESRIQYGQKIMLMGSCFTEHIGNALANHKFDTIQNPHGILFDTNSVTKSIVSYIDKQAYQNTDLFYMNEVWQSWQHHSRFAHIEKNEAVHLINQSQETAHEFLKNADWIIITLGSSFIYQLTDEAKEFGNPGFKVANCHRAPAKWFNKKMLEITETIALLDTLYHRVKKFNPKIKFIFTISPVRHLRDGVVDNNRSKARLIEAVHHTVNKFEHVYYFPAYELVIDVLRDYRFFDTDFAHPNYQATQFVLEKFIDHYFDDEAQKLYQEIHQIIIARKHRSSQPQTNAHRNFLVSNFKKIEDLEKLYPFLDFKEEKNYFQNITA